jgi:hypothetical protein
MLKKAYFPFLYLFATFLIISSGNAYSANYLKGVDSEGKKVYLGPTPIEETAAFKTYAQSSRSAVHEQQYLFQRLKDAPKNLEYFHDGNWYNWLETYRGGMWLIRNRYKKGQDTRKFLEKYVWRSEAGKLHLVRYPDGSIQVGYFLLMNELDLLEETLKKKAV